jgi:hypothetical protein
MCHLKKILFLSIIFSLIGNVLFSQDLKIGQRLIVGTSLTYIYNVEGSFFKDPRYQEFIWKKSIAINLNKSIYWGLSHHNIYSNGSSYVFNSNYRERTFIAGTFLQYDFLHRYKERVYLEVSWNYGNHCSCGLGDLYKKDGLSYFGLGGGFTFPITKIISLDLAFIGYFITSDENAKYAYNPYIIGLSFDLVNEKK